jgi:hypothetical protein
MLVTIPASPATAALPPVQVVTGYAHTCALAPSGLTYCWGSNSNGQLGDNTTTDRNTPVGVQQGGVTFTSITAGSLHTCGLTNAGQAYCWGYNAVGQLGDNPLLVLALCARCRRCAPVGRTTRCVKRSRQLLATASDETAYRGPPFSSTPYATTCLPLLDPSGRSDRFRTSPLRLKKAESPSPKQTKSPRTVTSGRGREQQGEHLEYQD